MNLIATMACKIRKGRYPGRYLQSKKLSSPVSKSQPRKFYMIITLHKGVSCISTTTLLQSPCASLKLFWTLAILRQGCQGTCGGDIIWCQQHFGTATDRPFFTTRAGLPLLPPRCPLTCASNSRTNRAAFRNSLSDIHVFFQRTLYSQPFLVRLLPTIFTISQSSSSSCARSRWPSRSGDGGVAAVTPEGLTVAAAPYSPPRTLCSTRSWSRSILAVVGQSRNEVVGSVAV